LAQVTRSPTQKTIKLVAGGLVTGIEFSGTDDELCTFCTKGKHSMVAFKSSENRVPQKLKLIHPEFCGPKEEENWRGARFRLTLTRKTSVYRKRNKSDVKERFKEFKNMIENQRSRGIRVFLTNNGTGYLIETCRIT
jgi:hypothetical protein